jgi:hypothetical protein
MFGPWLQRVQWQTGAMRNLIFVAFVEPVAEGQDFPRTEWPLHITLVKFDVDTGPGDDVESRIAALADAPIRAALGAPLAIGEDARFGHRGSVAVSLVEAEPRLQALHEALVELVAGLEAVISTPHHTLANYRPHVTHHGSRRRHPGDVVVLDRVALVDMAPGGDRKIRRVLRLWAAAG